MLKYFSLDNTRNNLFKEIGETIKALYPIGVSKEAPEYHEYPGIKKIDAVIEQNITDNKRFNEPWKAFLKKLKSVSKKRIYNNSYPLEPAFSGNLILEQYQDKSFRRTKKIVFSVSQIAPYFTVFGVDETGIKDIRHDRPVEYSAVNVITESPYKEFENCFNLIKAEIEVQFPDYKFVPVRICVAYVEGLQTPSDFREESKVHNALFNGFFNHYEARHFRGEMYYGAEKSNINFQLLPPPALE